MLFAMAVASVLLVSATARAHAGIWRAYDILFAPDDSRRIVVRSDLWGTVISRDAGATWRWLCPEVFGGGSFQFQRRSMVVLAGGELLAASLFSGLYRSTENACGWSRVVALGDDVAADVVRSASGDLYVLGLDRGRDLGGHLWRSVDGVSTWSRFGEPLPAGFSPVSFVLGPGDRRLYVAGRRLADADAATLMVSRDAGATWEALVTPAHTPSWEPRLLAVDPGDPEGLYLWADKEEASGGDVQPDALWFSPDGGRVWRRLLEGIGDLPGFALSPDGTTVAISGPEDGLLVAATEDIRAGVDGAFQRRRTGSFYGLSWTEEGLFAGGNDFAADVDQRFSVGVSTDEGVSFAPVLEVCDVRLLECTSDASVGGICPNFYSIEVVGGFKEDFVESPRCRSSADAGSDAASRQPIADAEPDAGLPGRQAGPSGCGCGVPSRAGDTHVQWVLFALAVIERRRRAASPRFRRRATQRDL